MALGNQPQNNSGKWYNSKLQESYYKSAPLMSVGCQYRRPREEYSISLGDFIAILPQHILLAFSKL